MGNTFIFHIHFYIYNLPNLVLLECSVGTDIQIAPCFLASIDHKNYSHVVEAAAVGRSALPSVPGLHGSVNVEVLVEALQERSMDVVVETSSDGVVITLPALQASVTVFKTGTTIATRSEPLRRLLRDLVVRQLALL